MDIDFGFLTLICAAFGLSSFLMLIGMLKLSTLSTSKLKRLLIIHSPKSENKALLLGGLPFSLLITMSLGLIKIDNPNLQLYINYSIIPFSLLILYGFLDDHYEILPKFKLLAQCLIGLIGTILYFQGKNVTPYITTFPAIYLLYVLVMNGTNLIDGIDTLSTKVAAGIFFQYTLLSLFSNYDLTLFISCVWMACLIPFSFFNRSPARMYLGEIGASMIGLASVSLFCLCAIQGAPIELCCIPLLYPVAEVTTSFGRRILLGKGPFTGDRLHIHQLLLSHYKYSSSQASWLLTSTDLLINSLAIGLYFRGFNWLSPAVGLSLHLLRQMAVGGNIWFESGFQWKENLINMISKVKKDSAVEPEEFVQEKNDTRAA